MLKGSEKYQPDHVNVLLRLIDFLTVRKNNLAAALTKHTGACLSPRLVTHAVLLQQPLLTHVRACGTQPC